MPAEENVKYATCEALDRVDNRLTRDVAFNKEAIARNSESIIELKTLYGSLLKLPDTISSLEKTVIGINNNLEKLTDRMDNMRHELVQNRDSIEELREENRQQNKNIQEVDNKSKIDWIQAINANFWKIIALFGVAYYILKDLIGKV